MNNPGLTMNSTEQHSSDSIEQTTPANSGVGLLPMATRQSIHVGLFHRNREQAQSHPLIRFNR